MSTFMSHVMLDLETMDTKPTSSIIEIAAQFFDPLTGELGQSFQSMVSLNSCVSSGLTLDADTVIWWMQQKEAARGRYKKNSKEKHINVALVELMDFLNVWSDSDEKLYVWGNGKEFDCEILKNAYRQCLDIDTPWDFRNTCDVRTVATIGGLLGAKNHKELQPFSGVYHNPLDDAKHQIKYVTSYLQNMRKEPANV